MGFSFGQRSLMRMEGVYPPLVGVAKLAITLSPIDFMVVEGVRNREGCMINYGKGRTAAQLAVHGIPAKYAKPGAAKVTWLRDPFNSAHCIQENGYGGALDLLPAPYDWVLNDPKSTPEIDDAFAKVALVMLQAAAIKNVRIRWGANWDGDKMWREKGETDNPHFEMIY